MYVELTPLERGNYSTIIQAIRPTKIGTATYRYATNSMPNITPCRTVINMHSENV